MQTTLFGSTIENEQIALLFVRIQELEHYVQTLAEVISFLELEASE